MMDSGRRFELPDGATLRVRTDRSGRQRVVFSGGAAPVDAPVHRPRPTRLQKTERQVAAVLEDARAAVRSAVRDAEQLERRAPSLQRRLYCIGWFWPEDAEWAEAQQKKTGARSRPPSWYAWCVQEFVGTHARTGVVSIRLHLPHSFQLASDGTAHSLVQKWRRAFDENVPAGSRETLSFDYTGPTDAPMASGSMRCIPLLDDDEDRIVVVLDAHDDLDSQTARLEEHLRRMDARRDVHAVFTAWESEADDIGVKHGRPRDLAPHNLLEIRAEAPTAWHLDCGMLITDGVFRRAARMLRVPTYREHYRHCADTFVFEQTQGTDEMMLEYYLLSGRPCDSAERRLDLCVLSETHAALYVHDVDDRPKKEGKSLRSAQASFANLPAVRPRDASGSRGGGRRRAFVYAREVVRHGQASLSWAFHGQRLLKES